MATNSKKRDLLSSRRRVVDEGEDDEGPEDLGDDSQSEASILTMDDNAAAADESDLSEISRSEAVPPNAVSVIHDRSPAEGNKQQSAPITNGASADQGLKPVISQSADVEAMLNGLKIDGISTNEEALDFEESADQMKPVGAVAKPNARSATLLGQQVGREERQQTRGTGSGPAAVNGHRKGQAREPSAATDQDLTIDEPSSMPTHSAGRGGVRGRGHGIITTGSYQRPLPPHAAPASNAKWSHDLHESVQAAPLPQPSQARLHATSGTTAVPKPSARPSLSRTVARGNVAARILLLNMKAPKILDSKITIREHTRLPDLRPPLRRDKAVRVSLPNHPPRYVFPSWERSFIFIPRAQRPNQQAKLRRGYGSRGGSRRTSMHGSLHSPSVAMSRRSSMAGNGVLSPNGSMPGRPPPGAPTGPGRPIVRFPSHTGGRFMQPGYGSADMTYPLPSEPAQRKHRDSQMAMHHPRPQKQMSVASIEGEQQAFHQQLPYNPGNQDARVPSAANTIPSQPHVASPLQNIPESAVNAPAFEPFNGPSQPYFYPMQRMYYYPTPDSHPPPPYVYPPMASPGFMQPPPYFTPMFVPMQGPSEVNPNTYMQETNGMIYYYDSSQMPGEQGPPPMMTPGPEFYPAQPPSAFYPPQ